MVTLTDFCGEVQNYFLRDRYADIHVGTFEISGGYIQPLEFLQEGQYYRIVGSTFNDGVWIYPFEGLKDETFSGSIWAMYVPPAVLSLVDEIDRWVEDHTGAIESPYQSESFDGYSYTKSDGGVATGSSSAITWQAHYGSRLNQWRKLRAI